MERFLVKKMSRCSGECKKEASTKSDLDKAGPTNSNGSDNHVVPSKDKEDDEGGEWWLPQSYHGEEHDKLCQMVGCSFEPEKHIKHRNPQRNLSLQERRILLKYLVKTRSIHKAKGIKVYQTMISQGYLTHRTVESLRNCLRRRILPNIKSYKLPSDIVRQFESLKFV